MMRVFSVRGSQNQNDRQMLSSPEGNESFCTLTDALRAASLLPAGEKCRIELSEGIYRENVSITRPDLEICGADPADPSKTVLTGNLGAYEILEDGMKRGTFRTQTVFLHADRVTLKDLTIENTAGPGRNAGQAVALYADGDLLKFENVRLSGWQDTLFTGPLPEHEVEKGGFRGPLEHAPRIPGRHYYKNCFLEGNIDFIFGGAAALFEECRIFTRRDPAQVREMRCTEDKNAEEQYYITAASTPEGQPAGYVFYRCVLTGDCPEGSVYLGRPWRDYARTAFVDCIMDSCIAPEGWHDWGKAGARKNAWYGECGTSILLQDGGVRAAERKDTAGRADFAKCMTREEAEDLLSFFRVFR